MLRDISRGADVLARSLFAATVIFIRASHEYYMREKGHNTAN